MRRSLPRPAGTCESGILTSAPRSKTGDVLAEIGTPEVDQQLNQARAQLKVAQSARDLSEAT